MNEDEKDVFIENVKVNKEKKRFERMKCSFRKKSWCFVEESDCSKTNRLEKSYDKKIQIL